MSHRCIRKPGKRKKQICLVRADCYDGLVSYRQINILATSALISYKNSTNYIDRPYVRIPLYINLEICLRPLSATISTKHL